MILQVISMKVAPTTEEQQAIANSLDHKTSEIDNLIADKKSSLPYSRNTGGYQRSRDQGAGSQCKDEGFRDRVDRRIPEHWEVKKVKYVASINRKTLSENTPDDFEIDYIDIGAVDSTGTISAISRLDFSLAPSRARRIISPEMQLFHGANIFKSNSLL